MLVDFTLLKGQLRSCLADLDHQLLNNIEGLKNPSAENIAQNVFNKISPECPYLWAVEIFETDTSMARYEKD